MKGFKYVLGTRQQQPESNFLNSDDKHGYDG